MIALLTLALAAQGGGWTVRPAAPTVGDTVRLERVVPAPPGAVGRPRALESDHLLEPLRAPEVAPADGGLLVRYTVAFFATGRHAVAMPALEVVHPDGAIELVLGDTVEVVVRRVVPDTLDAAPRDSRAPLARIERSPVPLALALGLSLTVLALWVVARYRRGRPAPAAQPAVPVPNPPLMRWLAVGERRAVATLAMDRLRARIGAGVPQASPGLALAECLALAQAARPDWPMRELGELLAALERARFAPLAADDLAELIDRADVLVERLEADPAPAIPAGA